MVAEEAWASRAIATVTGTRLRSPLPRDCNSENRSMAARFENTGAEVKATATLSAVIAQRERADRSPPRDLNGTGELEHFMRHDLLQRWVNCYEATVSRLLVTDSDRDRKSVAIAIARTVCRRDRCSNAVCRSFQPVLLSSALPSVWARIQRH
ncbi:MAG: hypothetical protein AAFX40_17685 [Cyanobacteria bacterium J06639_1]